MTKNKYTLIFWLLQQPTLPKPDSVVRLKTDKIGDHMHQSEWLKAKGFKKENPQYSHI